MLTLYFSPGSSSMATHIALHEIGVPFEAKLTALHENAHRAPGYARNSLRLPSQTSIDPRLTRDIAFFGGTHLQLIAEAFNLTNRSNVTRVRNTAYNLAGSTLTPVAQTLPAGYLSPSAVAGPRTYQFAAKFLF